MRLTSPEVKRLLARGQRESVVVAGIGLSSRILPSASVVQQHMVPAPPPDRATALPGGALSKIALSIPKRLVKRAVDRNRVKRVLRESFRQHRVHGAGLETLITLSSIPKERAKTRRQLRALRMAAEAAFDQILLKRGAR